jgi:hypothetical protein
MKVKELIELIKDYPEQKIVIFEGIDFLEIIDADDKGEFVQITAGDCYEQ